MAKRILIADDSQTIQKAFAMSFGGEDLTLLSARSAEEGLTIARQVKPELVIADGVMPGRSGYELCAAIKSDPTLRGVPVYILTSSHHPYDEVRGRQSGADGQLTKPFEAWALVERVGEALAKGVVATAGAFPGTVPSMGPVVSEPRGMPPSPDAALSDDADYGEITVDGDMPFEPALAAAAAPAPPMPMPVPMAIPPTPISPFPPALPSTTPAGSAAFAASAVPEISPSPRAPVAAPAPPPRPAAPGMTSTTPSVPGGLRPSLIPGMRPGSMAVSATSRLGAAPPPARPFAAPGSTVHFSAPGHVSPSPGAPGAGSAVSRSTAPPASPGPARTLVGLPASALQPPPRVGMTVPGTRSGVQPLWPSEARTPAPAIVPPPIVAPVAPPPVAPPSAPLAGAPAPAQAQVAAAVLSKVDQKVAAIAARGPEYEAIAKLSREIIERIVWEIVPDLAEAIVREELHKRGRV